MKTRKLAKQDLWKHALKSRFKYVYQIWNKFNFKRELDLKGKRTGDPENLIFKVEETRTKPLLERLEDQECLQHNKDLNEIKTNSEGRWWRNWAQPPPSVSYPILPQTLAEKDQI